MQDRCRAESYAPFPITSAVRASVGVAEAVFIAKHAAAIMQIDKPSRDRRGNAAPTPLIICSALSDWGPLAKVPRPDAHPNSSNDQILKGIEQELAVVR
jgi:hypothetical protein